MYQTTENTKGNIDREIPNTVKKEINMEELKNKTKEKLKRNSASTISTSDILVAENEVKKVTKGRNKVSIVG